MQDTNNIAEKNGNGKNNLKSTINGIELNTDATYNEVMVIL